MHYLSACLQNVTFPSYTIPGPNGTACNRWRNTGYNTSTTATSITYRFTRRIIVPLGAFSCSCKTMYWSLFEQGTYFSDLGTKIDVC
jgi:hypothetical protein